MLEIVTSILSNVKNVTPAILFGVALASGLVLFSPDATINNLGLDGVKHAYKAQIGGAFVVSLALCVSHFLFAIFSLCKDRFAEMFNRRTRYRMLRELTPAEKGHLTAYILHDENTQYFDVEDGIAGGLEAKNVIYRASNMGNLIHGWAYNMQPWARRYLKQNPELLGNTKPNATGQ